MTSKTLSSPTLRRRGATRGPAKQMQCMDVSLARSSQPAQLSTLHTCDILHLSVCSSSCQYPNFGARRHGLTLPNSGKSLALALPAFATGLALMHWHQNSETCMRGGQWGVTVVNTPCGERHGSIDSALSMMSKIPNKSRIARRWHQVALKP